MQRIVIFYYRTWVCMRVCRRTRVSHFLLIITTTHLIALAIKNAWFAFADFFFFFALFLPPPPAWWRTSKSSCTRLLLLLSEATMEPGCVCVFFFLARMRIPVTESQKAQKGGRRRGKTVDSFRKISRIGKKKLRFRHTGREGGSFCSALPWKGGRKYSVWPASVFWEVTKAVCAALLFFFSPPFPN